MKSTTLVRIVTIVALALSASACVEDLSTLEPGEPAGEQRPLPPRATLHQRGADGAPALAGESRKRRDDGPPIPDAPDSISELITVASTFYEDSIWYNVDYRAVVNTAGSVFGTGYAFDPPPLSDYTFTAWKRAAKGDGASWQITPNLAPASGTLDEAGSDIAVSGNAVFVVAFAPKLISATSGDDWFVARYDATTGAVVWSQMFGTANHDVAGSLAYDAATDTLMVAGRWNNGLATMIMRLSGATGATLSTDTTSFTGESRGLAVDPTGALGSPGAAFYVAGSSILAAYSIGGAPLYSVSLGGVVAAQDVDVDLSTGTVCVAGYGSNLFGPSTGIDGFARQFSSGGSLDWSVNYDVSGLGQTFNGVAARHGAGGCVAIGETDAAAGTNALTVAWNSVGVQSGVDMADDGNGTQDNVGWTVAVARGGLSAGRALVGAEGWSQFGGAPGAWSTNGWFRWLNL